MGSEGHCVALAGLGRCGPLGNKLLQRDGGRLGVLGLVPTVGFFCFLCQKSVIEYLLPFQGLNVAARFVIPNDLITT